MSTFDIDIDIDMITKSRRSFEDHNNVCDWKSVSQIVDLFFLSFVLSFKNLSISP